MPICRIVLPTGGNLGFDTVSKPAEVKTIMLAPKPQILGIGAGGVQRDDVSWS